MTERPLSHDEADLLHVSIAVVRQADSMPTQLLLRHSEILDFYLESCPNQTHAIIALIGDYEWDD